MKRSSIKLMAIILIALISSCNDYSDKIYESGVRIELAELRDQQIEDLHYSLSFDIPNDINKQLSGSVKIELNYSKLESKPLLIDFRNPENHLKSMEINGRSERILFKNEHIIIDDKKLQPGRNSIEIKFKSGNRALNRNDEYLYTLFVPDRACTAFPCFDQPSLKARFKSTLNVPNDWIAVANSEQLNIKKLDSIHSYEFDFTKPISTYLYSFVAGKFDTITKEYEDITMTMYHRETDTEKLIRNTEKIFDLKYSSLKWLENYTQIDHPFKKLDFIVVPSFQYSGMEHPGAILYRDSKMFLSETSTIRDELNRANLIAHETAHLWFGNLVTMEWFSEVWLKEVFANFIAGKIVNPQYPNINHDLNFLISHYPPSYKIDRTKGANPIEQDLDNMKNAGTLYGSIIYHKAPIVMNQLEMIIGEEKLQTGIQEYLSNFSYDNATWDDLISILDSKSEDNLQIWSKSWVYEPEMPQYNIVTTQDANENFAAIIFEQIDPSDKGRNWMQNVTTLVNSSKYEVALKDTFSVINLSKPLKNTPTVKPNSNGLAYGYFKLDDNSAKELLLQLNSIEDPLLRCSMYITLWENMLNSNIKPIDLFNSYYNSITVENNAQNINLLLSYVNKIYWNFLINSEQEQSTSKLEETLWKEVNKRQNPGIKSSLFKSYYSVANSEAHLKKLQEIFNEDLKINDLNLSEKDFTNLAFVLMIKSKDNADNIFNKQLQRITDLEKQTRFKFISEAITSSDSFFESLKDEKNREKEPWVVDALYYLHHPLKAKESVKYIKSSLAMLEELQITGDIFFPKRWLDATFSGHSSSDAVIEISLFLSENQDFPENLKNKILQSTDLVYRASIIRND